MLTVHYPGELHNRIGDLCNGIVKKFRSHHTSGFDRRSSDCPLKTLQKAYFSMCLRHNPELVEFMTKINGME